MDFSRREVIVSGILGSVGFIYSNFNEFKISEEDFRLAV